MRIQKINSGKLLDFYSASVETKNLLPFVDSKVKAGFPSPAEDFTELSIDLNEELLKNPPSTFFCRVNGDSMNGLGIYDGDLLIVDKSLEVQDGKIVVCFLDGEFTLKKIKIENDCCWLVPANKSYKPIKVTSENEFIVWGVVIHSIKSF